MEERRRADDKNWDSILEFISESREYRASDKITQQYVSENIEKLTTKPSKKSPIFP